MSDTGSHYNNPRSYYHNCNGNTKPKNHSDKYYVKGACCPKNEPVKVGEKPKFYSPPIIKKKCVKAPYTICDKILPNQWMVICCDKIEKYSEFLK